MPDSKAEVPLSGARADFVHSLGKRLEALRSALGQLEENPKDAGRREFMLRRVHAFGSASRVLGFATVAEAVGELERLVARPNLAVDDLKQVRATLDSLPQFLHGAGQVAIVEQSEPEQAGRFPLCLLIFGEVEMRDAVNDAIGGEAVEVESASDLETAVELASLLNPDIVILDADQPGARTLFEKFSAEEISGPRRTVVVGQFNNPRVLEKYTGLNADRLLTKPVSPGTWRSALRELGDFGVGVEPYRPFGEVTVAELGDRIIGELKKGLVDAVDPAARGTSVPLGEGTDVMAAVWGAVTRVRELVTLHSEGEVRFEDLGPEGAIPLAPGIIDEPRSGARGTGGAAEPVSLKGRRVVVADDDPAVAWFLSDVLRSAGAEVLEAHDGQQALVLAQSEWPDLVVTDILMPKLDGITLCREIKRDVAIRDVPVVLLSWKEDLLQRVRELGAEADGYLRKEATAPTVVSRLQEVLRPRARVEKRLKSGGEVRGRLDGLTTRFVLSLCCRDKEQNLRLTLRDAFFDYAIEVREGRPVAAFRRGDSGEEEAGPEVLPSVLGANAGRFVVRPETTPLMPNLQGDLRGVLTPAIQGARRAQRALSPARLPRVTRLRFADGFEHYLSATPDPARGVLTELAGGKSPQELLQTGAVWPEVLDRALMDVARRGLIAGIDPEPEDEPDPEMLAPKIKAAMPKRNRQEPREASLVPPKASGAAQPKPEEAFDDVLADSPQPPQAETSDAPEVDAAFASAMVPTPLGTEVADLEPPGSVADRDASSKEKPSMQVSESEAPESKGRRPAFTFQLSPEPARVGGVDLASAIVAPPVVEEEPARAVVGNSTLVLEPGPTAETVDDDGWFESALADDVETRDPGAVQPVTGFGPELGTRPGVGPAEAKGASGKGTPGLGQTAPLPEAKQITFPAKTAILAPERAVPVERVVPVERPASTEPLPPAAPQPVQHAQPPAAAPVAAQQAAPAPEPAATKSNVPVVLQESSAPKGADAPPDAASSPALTSPTAGAAPAAVVAAKETKQAEEKPKGMLTQSVYIVAGAVGAFLVTRALTGQLGPQAAQNVAPPPVQQVVSAQPAAPTAPAQKSAAPEPAVNTKMSASSAVEDLPPGMVIGGDKGVLKVLTSGSHSIYVDGEFAGRGPVRIVPVSPGEHKVKVRLDGVESSFDASVSRGKVTALQIQGGPVAE